LSFNREVSTIFAYLLEGENGGNLAIIAPLSHSRKRVFEEASPALAGWQICTTCPASTTSSSTCPGRYCSIIHISLSTIKYKMSDDYSQSPPQFGRIPRPRAFLPLNSEDGSPMATHGNGILTSLIKSRSHASLYTMHRRPSSFRGRDTPDDEEIGPFDRLRRNSTGFDDGDDFRRSDERRLSAVLNGPQMRSQRLIGNSNPRYRWERYWKTEEELDKMKKPMQV